MKKLFLTVVASAVALASSSAFAADNTKRYNRDGKAVHASKTHKNHTKRSYNDRMENRTWSDNQAGYKHTGSYKYFKDEGLNRFEIGTPNHVITAKSNATVQ